MAATEYSPIRVMIVEDAPVSRAVFAQAIGRDSGIEVVCASHDLPQAMAAIEAVCPDVLLVDLGLPRGSGLHVIRRASALWRHRCTAAVLTLAGPVDVMFEAIGFGAKGVLFKNEGVHIEQELTAEWCPKVRELHQGMSPMYPELAQALLDRGKAQAPMMSVAARDVLRYVAAGYTLEELARRSGCSAAEVGRLVRTVYDGMAKDFPSLPDRQLEVLKLLDKGLSQKECADVMGIELSVVKTHLQRVYEKLKVNSLQAALYEARHVGLLT
jgi:DNA-binding NarL/FixJ family response regulator